MQSGHMFTGGSGFASNCRAEVMEMDRSGAGSPQQAVGSPGTRTCIMRPFRISCAHPPVGGLHIR
jgi:hypothetical protein